MIRLFVGFDSEQALASSVFAHSVCRRASEPVSVQYLMLSQLRGVFDRPRDANQSTEHAFSRFLVPYLCGYYGWAMFADGDMIYLDDIAKLWAMRDASYSVQVVKRESHEMTASGLKFLGRKQISYPRKNWSSVMLFNTGLCRMLTPDYVAKSPGLDLHRFAWAESGKVGALPKEFNHLVGVDAPDPTAKLVHYTLGMPYLTGLNECEFAHEWRMERDSMMTHVRGCD